MIVRKLDIKYDVARLWNECVLIIGKYGWGKLGQINMTHEHQTTDEIEKVFKGVGSLKDTNVREKHFDTFNENFKNSYLYEVFLSLPYQIGRFRLMRMRSRTCYSVHRDSSIRLHLPLVTNPQALMIFPNDSLVVHLPADGHVYLTETTILHTAMNGGLDDRYHLVGALKEP